jgi:hypothetical protein
MEEAEAIMIRCQTTIHCDHDGCDAMHDGVEAATRMGMIALAKAREDGWVDHCLGGRIVSFCPEHRSTVLAS